MAIIGKIRDNGWLVLVVIGVALIAFIMGDWSKITGGDEPKYGYGTVYGEKVDEVKFNERLAQAQENARLSAQQQGQAPQDVDETAVWKAFVETILLEKEYEALGINVSEDEFDAYLYATNGFEVLQDFNNPQFMDSVTNTFDPKKLEARIEEMKGSDDPKQVEAWEDTEEYYTDKRKREKYFDILGQGVYVTSLEAKNEYMAQGEKKTIEFVVKRFSDISDMEYPVSDKTLKAYYEKHKNDKKYLIREASRKVRYFDIKIQPSRADSSKFIANMNKIKKQFAATTNDSTFVMNSNYNDMRYYTSGPFSTALPKTHPNAQQHITYPQSMDVVFQTAQVGQFIGPYDNDGATAIAKVIGFTSDTTNARHILIKVEAGDDRAKKEALADSIMKMVNDGNFAELVTKYSEDEGSAAKGGDLGDFFFSSMVRPFAAFVADEPIGKIGKVESEYGFHIVQVTKRKGRQYPRVAIIQKTLVPSSETVEALESKAYKFLYSLDAALSKIQDPNKRLEKFDTLATRADYLVRTIDLKENAPAMFGFTTRYAEDKILDLAFNENAEVGDLVGSPVKDKDRHVIAIYTGRLEKGVPKFEDIKEQLRVAYIQEQKVKKFTAEMKGKKMDAIPRAIVQTGEVTFATPQINGAGMEPAVVGAIFASLKDGARSVPIVGNTGVFVVKVEGTIKPDPAQNYDKEKAQLLGMLRGQIQGGVGRALSKLADVVDNRRLFNTGIRR